MKSLLRMALVVILAGLASAALLRLAPGSTVDERELDPRLSSETIAALRAENAARRSFGAALVHNLRGFFRGDLGYSESQHSPIQQLVADRGPVTLRILGAGLFGAWLAGLGVAILAGRFQRARACDTAAAIVAGLLLSLPIALLAYLCSLRGLPPALALVLVIAPRIFRFSRNLIVQAYSASHVEMARASGVGETRVLLSCVLPSIAPQLVALAAASTSMAIGAAIPVEAICDTPGLGRLALQAATARDLPLLVSLTMLIALAITAAMGLAERLEKSR